MNGYQVHSMYRQVHPYPDVLNQAHPAGFGAGQYQMPPMYATGSTYMQTNHHHGQPIQQSQVMDRRQAEYRQLYERQMEQYLKDQRISFQQQQEHRMMTQRKIDQHKKVQLELASVRSKLGGNVCVVQNFPFKILPSTQKPELYGVVKISNLPYAVTKHEIQQLLGRHAGILNAEFGGGIHIIMERSTAKTMDAFVEFKTQKDADAAARRLSFTESGRYARLGTRHVDVTVSSQDELLHDLFPRAKCIEWRDGIPTLLPNTDPYSAGFQGFLTSEEIRGLVSHALNPARSPFTERCRQRTYECLISTLWKFPWFATAMYTVGDRDELYQATMQQILELSDRVKQRKVIGLNESLLMDLLRAGMSCPSFNERQKICLLAAAELPSFSPIVHWKFFEFWPFDCLAKGTSATEYEVMFYAQLIRRGLGICDKDDLAIPNNWRNRDNLVKESPWGHMWIEWHLHNKDMTFEAAANLEMQLASDLLEVATGADHQYGMSNKNKTTVIAPSKPVQIKHNPGPIPNHWVEEIAKRDALNCESPSRQSSDDDGLPLAVGRVRLDSGTSSTFSGGFSHIGSTNGSMTTYDGENKAISQEKSAPKEGNHRTRHQHSQSLSAIAASEIPPSFGHNLKNRRRESISVLPPAVTMLGMDNIAPPQDAAGIDVGTLMAQHGIWSTAPGDSASFAVSGGTSASSGEPESLNRSGHGSRHTPNLSLTSQQSGLTVVSEDEEDIFNKYRTTG